MTNLSTRLERLEHQLDRLTNLLADQARSRQRRRRLLTIRFMLVSVIAFALLFAAYGSLYRKSLRQARSVDTLIDQGAFVLFSPRESLWVSLLPGEPTRPSRTLTNMLGDDFFRSVTNVSTGPRAAAGRDKQKVLRSLADVTELQRLRLTNLALRSDELHVLGNLSELQSLDLSRTGLDSGAMPWLRSTQMRWFNASHTCIGDRAMINLAQCVELQELYLERTCLTDDGLVYLHSMPNLRYVNLKRSPVSAAAVRQLSAALPNCIIEWEPLVFRPDGRVDALAARRGRIRIGRGLPQDPRVSRRAQPPLDRQPSPAANQWMTIDSLKIVRPYPGFTLGVF